MAKKKNSSKEGVKDVKMVSGRVVLPQAYKERIEQTKRMNEMMKAKPSSSYDIKPTDFLNAFFWDDALWRSIPANTKKSYIFKVFQALSADTNMSMRMHQLQGCENIQTLEALRVLYKKAYGMKRAIPQWVWTFWRKRTEERHTVTTLTDEHIDALCDHFEIEEKYLRMFWDNNKIECEQYLKTL